MDNFQIESRTVVDNWLLELASRLLDTMLDRLYLGIDSYRGYYVSEERFYQEKVIALFQLLDLIVVSDKLIFDADWAHIWAESEYMKPIESLLAQVRLGVKKKTSIVNNWRFPVHNDTPEIIREGALYYFTLANLLGTFYWPSPQRAKFLRNTIYENTGSSFTIELSVWLDGGIKHIVNEAIAPLNLLNSPVTFTGFGATILAECNDRKSILPIAMEFRESKECTEFRKWLYGIEKATHAGDIKVISDAISDVKDVFEYLQKDLGIEKKNDQKVELEIGLSPSVNVDVKSIFSGFNKLKPKPYHITFLRRHFSRILRNADASKHVKRLFPEMKEYQIVPASSKT